MVPTSLDLFSVTQTGELYGNNWTTSSFLSQSRAGNLFAISRAGY